jgi:hypothetical protein
MRSLALAVLLCTTTARADDAATLTLARAKLAEADRYERAGRAGSAFRAVTAARSLIRSTADRKGKFSMPEAEELNRLATARLGKLRPSWRTISVSFKGPVEIVVEQDGVPIPTSEWGQRIPIDSGDHVFTAKMENWVFWRHAQTLTRGGSAELFVENPQP